MARWRPLLAMFLLLAMVGLAGAAGPGARAAAGQRAGRAARQPERCRVLARAAPGRPGHGLGAQPGGRHADPVRGRQLARGAQRAAVDLRRLGPDRHRRAARAVLRRCAAASASSTAAAARPITRFGFLERFTHWLTATCFVVLALTGLNMLYGRYVLRRVIGPEAFSWLTASAASTPTTSWPSASCSASC